MDPRLRNQANAASTQQQQQRNSSYSVQNVFPNQQPDQGAAAAQDSGALQNTDPRYQRPSSSQTQTITTTSGAAAQSSSRPSQRRPQVHSKPSGPPKRNKQFQEQDPDCFHPRYKLSFMHPYVPVEPKLFTYRLNTDEAASKYEYSCVELNQPHQLLVDYNMGMRIDLVDKEKYQVNPQQQRQMLLGEQAPDKNEDELTEKMLDSLKAKLLSTRDRFILSSKDILPELDPIKKAHQPLPLQKSLSMLSDATIAQQESAANKKGAVIMTGQSEKKNLAIQQIKDTFERSKGIKVGAQKVDGRGRPIKGVTAVSVKDITPMHQAELLKMSMVVNDDELDKTTMDAGNKNNGHLLHAFRDKLGDMRQSFYSLQAQEEIPDMVKEIIVGKKRTAKEAGFAEHDKLLCNKAIQLQHIRDYAFTEMKGGSKGESADYLLYDTGNDVLQLVPITSKLKLNKKRKAQNANTEEGAQRPDISHIVMASRAYSKDEARGIGKMFGAAGLQTYKVSAAMTPFEQKEDVQDADRRVSDLLKEIFRPHLPKVEVEDAVMAADGSDSADDGFFGVNKGDQGPPVHEESSPQNPAQEENKVALSEESGEDDIF